MSSEFPPSRTVWCQGSATPVPLLVGAPSKVLGLPNVTPLSPIRRPSPRVFLLPHGCRARGQEGTAPALPRHCPAPALPRWRQRGGPNKKMKWDACNVRLQKTKRKHSVTTSLLCLCLHLPPADKSQHCLPGLSSLCQQQPRCCRGEAARECRGHLRKQRKACVPLGYSRFICTLCCESKSFPRCLWLCRSSAPVNRRGCHHFPAAAPGRAAPGGPLQQRQHS